MCTVTIYTSNAAAMCLYIETNFVQSSTQYYFSLAFERIKIQIILQVNIADKLATINLQLIYLS